MNPKPTSLPTAHGIVLSLLGGARFRRPFLSCRNLPQPGGLKSLYSEPDPNQSKLRQSGMFGSSPPPVPDGKHCVEPMATKVHEHRQTGGARHSARSAMFWLCLLPPVTRHAICQLAPFVPKNKFRYLLVPFGTFKLPGGPVNSSLRSTPCAARAGTGSSAFGRAFL